MPSFKTMAVLAVLLTSAAPSSNLNGHWTLSLDPGFSGEAATLECDAIQDDGALTLECDDTPVSTGRIDGHTVTFVIMTGRDNLLPAKFAGTLDTGETVISGTWRLEDTGGNRIGRFRADKHP
jgi:hypothetical protein